MSDTAADCRCSSSVCGLSTCTTTKLDRALQSCFALPCPCAQRCCSRGLCNLHIWTFGGCATQALAAGAAVSRGVSRRPIGGPVPKRRQPEATPLAHTSDAAAADTAAPAPKGGRRRPVTAAADADADNSTKLSLGTSDLVAELEAAMGGGRRGNLYEGEDTGLFDGGGDGGGSGGDGGGGGDTKKRKRGGPLGGRLRKKLARQRAAAVAAPSA